MDKSPAELRETNAKKFKKEPIPGEIEVINDLPSMSNSSENIFISKLPIEVIEYIFRLLPPRERRIASLVCKKWHELSVKMYSNKEKFVFRGYQNYEKLLLFLSGTKRRFLNLEFHSCTFHNSSNLLSLSERINSLCFRDCALSHQFKIELFVKCQNLKEFCYTNYAEIGVRNTATCFTHEILASLIEKGFVNKNLQILRLNVIAEFIISDYISLVLFHLFPNIKHLKFLEKPRWPTYNDGCEDSYSKFLVPKVISMKNELETLKIVVHGPGVRILQSHNFNRLKRISFYLEWEVIRKTSIIDIISGLVNLQKVSLKINFPKRETGKSVTPFIIRFIQLCFHLKRITVKTTSHRDFYLSSNRELFQALVSSNLISFKTNADFLNDDNEPFSASDFSVENKTLQILSIPKCTHYQLLFSFIQCFKNLKYITFRCPEVVKSIGHCQRNLESLTLYSSLEHLRFPTNLESLNLDLHDSISFDCANIPCGIKYLRLNTSVLFSSSVNETLRESLVALKNCKELETVSVKTTDKQLMDLNLWIDICSSLKKLRLLCLHDGHVDPPNQKNLYQLSETHNNLFNCCPSLRCLVLSTHYSNWLVHYDQLEKKISFVNEIDYPIHTDFITTGSVAGSEMKFYYCF